MKIKKQNIVNLIVPEFRSAISARIATLITSVIKLPVFVSLWKLVKSFN